MQELTEQEFLNQLCPRWRPMIARVLACTCACQTLDFFRRRPLAWLEAGDIAYHVHRPQEETIEILNQLTEVGLLDRFTVLGSRTFYGLPSRGDILQALEQFWAWRDQWNAQLEQVKNTLQLQVVHQSTAESL